MSIFYGGMPASAVILSGVARQRQVEEARRYWHAYRSKQLSPYRHHA
jgi:pentatricopeptide repeat protein